MSDNLICVQVHLEPEILRQLQTVYSEFYELEKHYICYAPKDSDLILIALNDYLEYMQYRLDLRKEIKSAIANGGRTDYLYNEDGAEYYTTTDGVRHYTRLEG